MVVLRGLGAQSAASQSELPADVFMVMMDAAGGREAAATRLGCGQAELGGPALDVGPEPVTFVQVGVAGHVGEDHRGDGGVAVQGLAGQPGHLPSVPAGRVPGGVGSVVAGHEGVVDGQGHGSASRSGSGWRVRAGWFPGARRGTGAGPAANRGAGRR